MTDIDEILDTFEFLEDWEDKYRFIIDLGKGLPDMPDTLKRDEYLVRGCQSQVWLVFEEKDDGQVVLHLDSDALIVRGLIAIVMATYQGKSREGILQTDIDAVFSRLELMQHLSPTRGNGLMAMLGRIRDYASQPA